MARRKGPLWDAAAGSFVARLPWLLPWSLGASTAPPAWEPCSPALSPLPLSWSHCTDRHGEAQTLQQVGSGVCAGRGARHTIGQLTP